MKSYSNNILYDSKALLLYQFMSARNTIQQIFQEARRDASLQNTLNIDALLSGGVTPMNQDSDRILTDLRRNAQENADFLKAIGVPRDVFDSYLAKLDTYCHIEELHELRFGKYLKWMAKTDLGKIRAGGNLVGIKFGESGVLLTIRIPGGRVFQLKFDNHHIFQKLEKKQIMIGSMVGAFGASS